MTFGVHQQLRNLGCSRLLVLLHLLLLLYMPLLHLLRLLLVPRFHLLLLLFILALPLFILLLLLLFDLLLRLFGGSSEVRNCFKSNTRIRNYGRFYFAVTGELTTTRPELSSAATGSTLCRSRSKGGL